MRKIVNIREAKTHLSRLLVEVEEHGAEVLIARYNKPIAKLVALQPDACERLPGSAKGEFTLSESFFEPLPAEFLESFEK